MPIGSDKSYNTKVHGTPNGDGLVAESGATIALLAGSTLQAGTTPILPADLAPLGGMSAAVETFQHIAKVPLGASDAAGGIFAWLSPTAGPIDVTRVDIDATTKATGACTIDVGTTVVSAATKSDNLLDGIDVGTAAALLTLVDQAGANGRNRQRLAAGGWVTGSTDSGAAAGLAGFAYIHYFPL